MKNTVDLSIANKYGYVEDKNTFTRIGQSELNLTKVKEK